MVVIVICVCYSDLDDQGHRGHRRQPTAEGEDNPEGADHLHRLLGYLVCG